MSSTEAEVSRKPRPLVFKKQKLGKYWAECAIVVWFKPPQPENPATIARYRAVGAAIVEPTGLAWFGVAVCSPKDQFIRKVGRNKAVGRAVQHWEHRGATPKYCGDLPSTLRAIKKAVDEELAYIIAEKSKRGLLL